MIDINLIKENPKKIQEALKRKLYDVDFEELLLWDKQRKELLVKTENNKAEQNRLSKSDRYGRISATFNSWHKYRLR